jgi:hypothetical protein
MARKRISKAGPKTPKQDRPGAVTTPLNPQAGAQSAPDTATPPGYRTGPRGNVARTGDPRQNSPGRSRGTDAPARAAIDATVARTREVGALRHNPPNTIASQPGRGYPGTAPIVESQYSRDSRQEPQPYIDDVDVDRNWFCYSADTEILTRRGWVLFKDLVDADEVATRNPTTKEFEWQRPTHRPSYDYVGKMHHFASRYVDILVTPEHRMLVASVGNARERIVSAQEFASSTSRSNWRLPLTSQWRGQTVRSKVFNTEHHASKALHLSGDDFCLFMGMYLSEGSPDSVKFVKIGQSPRSKQLAWFSDTLTAMFGPRVRYRPYRDGSGGGFRISSTALNRYVRQFGYAEDKFVPREILDASRRQLVLFWDAYMAGDGSVHTHKSVSGHMGRLAGKLSRIKTVSPRMADHLQEIAIKLGYASTVGMSAAQDALIQTGTGRSYITHQRASYRVTLHSKRQARVTRSSTELYRGKVYCVSVPNGIIAVRRNPALVKEDQRRAGREGRARSAARRTRKSNGWIWCGNSPMQPVWP